MPPAALSGPLSDLLPAGMPPQPNPAGFAALVFCLHVLPITALEFWVRRQHQAAYMRHRELLVCLGVSSVLYWAPVMGEWLCWFFCRWLAHGFGVLTCTG